MKHLLTLTKYFAQHKWRVLSGFLFIILANLFKTYNPSVVRHAAIQATIGLQKTADEIYAALEKQVLDF
jgi:alkyl sulfatase BDS1-like metallo-beta-lactamase superfamily hydrolase